MYTLLSEKVRKSSLLAPTIIGLMVFIGLIALVEKGPLVPGIPMGASPLSPLPLGTMWLVNTLRSNYTVQVILDYSTLHSVSGETCVFVVISPEKPYTLEESLKIINTLRSRCKRLKLLVADEEPTSNKLLEAVNSTIKIMGNRVCVGIGTITSIKIDSYLVHFTYSSNCYPKAIIRIAGNHTLVLDKASTVQGGIMVGYILREPEYLEVLLVEPSGDFKLIDPLKEHVPIAAREVVSDIEVVVIGDGSIFLNQVLSSNKSEYRVFISDLFSHLCSDTASCLVLFDATHYTTLSLTGREALEYIFSQVPRGDVVSLLYVASLIIPLILHPSTWLPPLVQLATQTYISVLQRPLAKEALIAIVSLFVLDSLLKNRISTRDRPLKEQVEEEVGVFKEIKRGVIRGEVRLGREDFIDIYRVLDDLSLMVWGVHFNDSRALEELSKLLGDYKRARKIWLRAIKVYNKALERKPFPIVVSWRREIERLIDLTDELIAKLVDKIGVEGS
jgi:hypothetical protein